MRNPRALWRRSGIGVIVLGPGADQPRAILGPAAAVWDLTEQPATVDDMIAALSRHHRTDAEQVRSDVVTVVDELIRSGCLEQVP
jgi:hypothetical protein